MRSTTPSVPALETILIATPLASRGPSAQLRARRIKRAIGLARVRRDNISTQPQPIDSGIPKVPPTAGLETGKRAPSGENCNPCGEGALRKSAPRGECTDASLDSWLANAKRTVARALHSHAMEADAAQTDFCWKLSAVALLGLVANAVLGWWWADPPAALGLAALIAVEARRTWKTGTACC